MAEGGIVDERKALVEKREERCSLARWRNSRTASWWLRYLKLV